MTKKLLLILLVFLAYQVANAFTYGTLPNNPEWRSFYYYYDKANYSQILTSNMPYDVMVGYIVADSIVKNSPGIVFEENFIKNLNYYSDTASYLLKYLYLLAEYDAIKFNAFTSYMPNLTTRTTGNGILAYLGTRWLRTHLFRFVKSSYILHIYVNNTYFIDSSDVSRESWEPNVSETVAFCMVLDTLKGRVFPNLDNTILSNGQADTSISDEGISIPNIQTDIVFSYRNQWSRSDGVNRIPLFDSVGGHWIKPNREYIVFLEFLNITATDSMRYFTTTPYPDGLSFGMYPIIDGNVIDEGNDMGWGISVPVSTFKQKIREQINLIKHYGE